MKCAFYEKQVTPPIGSGIPGGFNPKRLSEGVEDDLYVKTVLFDDGERQAALVVIDAVELPGKFREIITARVREMTGIAPANVAVCGTHTHYGLPCGEPDGTAEDEPYMDFLCRAAADSVFLAREKLQPCRLSFAMGRVDGVSFNRDYDMSDGHILTNPGKKYPASIVRPYAENDPVLPVLFVEDEAGNKLGSIASFACHQDTTTGRKYSGDFSSEMSYKLKEAYGKDFVSIYLAGASGDINHIDFISRDTKPDYQRLTHRQIGQALAAEVIRLAAEAKPLDGDRVDSGFETVNCRLRHASEEELNLAKKIVRGEADASRLMLGALQAALLVSYEQVTEGQTDGDLPVQVMDVGGVTLFIMPGELYHQFGLKLRAQYPKSLVATLCNGFWGYMPVPELLGTDIYPAQLCAGSKWEPAAGDKLVTRALQMAGRLQAKG